MSNEWIPVRPIVGFNADGSPITVDSWSGKQRGPTLTDAEREAVETAYSRLTADTKYGAVAATLRGLLERLA